MIDEIIYVIFLLALFLIPLFYLRVIKEKSWKEIRADMFPKSKGAKREIVGSLALFGALLIGFLIVASAISVTESFTNTAINDLGKVGTAINEDLGSGIIFFGITLIVAVFLEEFFFRAFLVPRTGPIISTLIFTFFHLGYGSIAETIGVFCLGLILAYWYRKNNSLIQNYVGHFLYDLFAILLYAL